jgi:hypothetical protein
MSEEQAGRSAIAKLTMPVRRTKAQPTAPRQVPPRPRLAQPGRRPINFAELDDLGTGVYVAANTRTMSVHTAPTGTGSRPPAPAAKPQPPSAPMAARPPAVAPVAPTAAFAPPPAAPMAPFAPAAPVVSPAAPPMAPEYATIDDPSDNIYGTVLPQPTMPPTMPPMPPPGPPAMSAPPPDTYEYGVVQPLPPADDGLYGTMSLPGPPSEPPPDDGLYGTISVSNVGGGESKGKRSFLSVPSSFLSLRDMVLVDIKHHTLLVCLHGL